MNNHKTGNKMARNLRGGCTVVQGIGLKDIARIRQEKGIPYVKPHTNNGIYVR